MKRTPKGRLELIWMGKDSTLIPAHDGKYDYAWVEPTDPLLSKSRASKPLTRWAAPTQPARTWSSSETPAMPSAP